MELINVNKIKIFNKYFKKKGLINNDLNVLPLFINEEEYNWIVNNHSRLEEEIKQHQGYIKDANHIKTHSSTIFFPGAAISFKLIYDKSNKKIGLSTILFSEFLKMYNINNLTKFNNVIVIRKDKYLTGLTYSFVDGFKIDVNKKEKLTLLLFLLHEYIHCVEQKIKKIILPENEVKSLLLCIKILSDLPPKYVHEIGKIKVKEINDELLVKIK